MNTKSLLKFLSVAFWLCISVQANAADPKPAPAAATVSPQQQLSGFADSTGCPAARAELVKATRDFNEACGNMRITGGAESCLEKVEACSEGLSSDEMEGAVGLIGSALGAGMGTSAMGAIKTAPGCSEWTYADWKSEKDSVQDRFDEAQDDILEAKKEATENKTKIQKDMADTQKSMLDAKKELKAMPLKVSENVRKVRTETREQVNALQEKLGNLNIELADTRAKINEMQAEVAKVLADVVRECNEKSENDELMARKAIDDAKKNNTFSATSANDLQGRNKEIRNRLKKSYQDCIAKAKDKIRITKSKAEGEVKRLNSKINALESRISSTTTDIASAKAEANQRMAEVALAGQLEIEALTETIQHEFSKLDMLQQSLSSMDMNTQMATQLAQQKLTGAQHELGLLQSEKPAKGAKKNFYDAQTANEQKKMAEAQVAEACKGNTSAPASPKAVD